MVGRAHPGRARVAELRADGVWACADRHTGTQADGPPHRRGHPRHDELPEISVPLGHTVDDEAVGALGSAAARRPLVPVQAELHLGRVRQVEGRADTRDVSPRGPRLELWARADGLGLPDPRRVVGDDEQAGAIVPGSGVAVELAGAPGDEVVRHDLDRVRAGSQQDRVLYVERHVRLGRPVLDEDAGPPTLVGHRSAVDLEPEARMTLAVAPADPALGADPAGLDEADLVEREGQRQPGFAPPNDRDQPVGALALRGPLVTRGQRARAAVVAAVVAVLVGTAGGVSAEAFLRTAGRRLPPGAGAVAAVRAAVLGAGGGGLATVAGSVPAVAPAVLRAAGRTLRWLADPVAAGDVAVRRAALELLPVIARAVAAEPGVGRHAGAHGQSEAARVCVRRPGVDRAQRVRAGSDLQLDLVRTRCELLPPHQ